MKLQAFKYPLSRALFALLWMVTLAPWALAQSGSKILEIDDPLTNSRTLGSQHGGVLTSAGWVTQTAFDHIQYTIPTCPAGEIQFDIRGIYASATVFPNIEYDKYGNVVEGGNNVHYNFFSMWDEDLDNSWYGNVQWHNPYKCLMHIYGYTPGDEYKWKRMKLRLNVAAFNGGYDDDPHAFEDPAVGPFEWDKNHTYHHRLVWGEGHMRWYMDEKLLKDWDYSTFGADYAPPDHRIRIGSGLMSRSGGYQVPIDVTISNFRFYRYKDITPPEVVKLDPQEDPAGVAMDSDILVHFSEPMNASATQSAFSISPAVTGTFSWVGNALYLKSSSLLQANTTYTVQVTTAAKDNAGNALQSPFTGRFTTRSLTPAAVGKYEAVDITLVAPGLGSTNRYRDVQLKGEFKGPSKTLTIEGFWDGGDIFKVRIAPTEVGTWSYRITSSVSALNAAGSFQCVESGSKGFVRRNPARPYTFMYDDGTPWQWRGDTSWRGYTSLLPYDSRWQEYINLRASQGYTAMQSIVVSYINGNGFWKNEGGTCFAEYADGKNYDQLNPAYFHWIDKRIDYALSKEIVPVMFFTWAQEYALFSEAQFDKFCRYLVARYAAKNVIFVICGEYEEIVDDFSRPTSEYERWGKLIYDSDPYDHPITLHPSGRGTSAEFAGQSWFGFIMQQTPYYVTDMRRDRTRNLPVVNGEPRYFYPADYGNGPNDPSRVALWEIAANGGYYTAGFYTTYAPDKGGWDPAALPEEQLWAKATNEFLAQMPWSAMDPNHGLISSGNLMAKPGKSYFAYHATGGAVTLNLSGQLGSLQGRWLNPRTGVTSAPFTVQLGGSVTLSPPFSGDWALYVGDLEVGDKVPPLAPQDLAVESSTTRSMLITWTAPAAASDGDLAVKYRLLRDGVELAQVSETRYSDAGLKEATEYLYEVLAIDDAGNQSTTAASSRFRTHVDTEPPYVSRVTAVTADTLIVWFSEPVEPATAANIGNYQILQGIPVLSARTAADLLSARLVTGAHQSGKTYTLVIRGIVDRAATPNRMGPNTARGYIVGNRFDITGLTPADYQWGWLHAGDTYYTDRSLTLVDIPAALQNRLWLKTAHKDRQNSSAAFISFTLPLKSVVYVALDARMAAPPAWLASWTRSGLVIHTTDTVALAVYEKSFAAGPVQLGGNGGSADSRMYVVLVNPDQELLIGKRPLSPGRLQMTSN